EVDAAPDAHLLVLFRHLHEAVEAALQARVRDVGHGKDLGPGAEDGFENASRGTRVDPRLGRIFRMHRRGIERQPARVALGGVVVGTHTPGRVRGRYVSGTLVSSFWRSAKTLAAAFSPKAMPAARAGLSGTLSSVAANAVSMRAFWPGYCRIRISRAAAAAAASADAFGSAAISGVKRAYRFSTALTESDMDTCIIAMLRVHGLPAAVTAFITSM